MVDNGQPVGGGFCSGTVIAPGIFLTAASCLAGDSDPGFFEVFGGVDLFTNVYWTSRVKELHVSPDFDPQSGSGTSPGDPRDTALGHPSALASRRSGRPVRERYPFKAVGSSSTDPMKLMDAGVKRTVDLTIHDDATFSATFSIDVTLGKARASATPGGLRSRSCTRSRR